MQVTCVYPMGYCEGVQKAISLAIKAKGEHPNQDVYLLGGLIHNQATMDELSKRGLILLDERKTPLKKSLESLKEGDVVVFSAHGHDKKLDEIAKNKGIICYDATCSYVEDNLREANRIKGSFPIIYIGSKGHAESEAFLSNCPEAHFYDLKGDALLSKPEDGSAPHIICQTTISYPELYGAFNKIRELYPEAVIGKERCNATSLRQEGIRKLDSKVDVIIVLGSVYSNNSTKLFEIAKSRGFEAHLCRDLAEVKALDLSAKKNAALASGASTSTEVYKQVLEYLKSL